MNPKTHEIYEVLKRMEEDGYKFKNGTSACYWHIIGTINQHLDGKTLFDIGVE